MGWNQVNIIKDCSLFKDIPKNSFFYFVHSYYMKINEFTSSTSIYKNEKENYLFTSAFQKEYCFGVQFHPEKSSDLGIKLLENFRRL